MKLTPKQVRSVRALASRIAQDSGKALDTMGNEPFHWDDEIASLLSNAGSAAHMVLMRLDSLEASA